ncbi:MAG: ADP-ribosylglycohydrolase family protein [Erysipelotrichaceae bacterium]|nr:ADP-ribosylglycohydrolase family protein [Erysipelotrichaceae bacterium]
MLYDKILGSLLGAAIADAMGTPLESRPVYLIKQDLGDGGFVYDYKDMPADSFAPDMKKGMVSDDFSVVFASLEAFVKHKGISREASIEGLLNWVHDDRYKLYSSTYMGPTTKEGIQKLEGTYVAENEYREEMECDQKTITNGAAMKTWVAGLLNPGNVEKAIEDALTMGVLTHNNAIALSGGCSVAAATAVAMKEDATLDEIVEAGIYGARVGYEKAVKIAKDAAGASIAKRIPLAVKIGLRYSNDFEGCITEMTDVIGTGLFANEAVPSAFGFMVSASGDVMETVYRSINAGNDCDTTGVIAASMAGAFSGFSSIKDGEKHLKYLSEVNGMDIEKMAKDITELLNQ